MPGFGNPDYNCDDSFIEIIWTKIVEMWHEAFIIFSWGAQGCNKKYRWCVAKVTKSSTNSFSNWQ